MYFPDCLFEVLINCDMAQMAAKLVRENEIPRIVPSSTGALFLMLLYPLLFFQNRHHRWCYHNESGSGSFGRSKAILSAHFLCLGELLIDVNCILSLGKVQLHKCEWCHSYYVRDAKSKGRYKYCSETCFKQAAGENKHASRRSEYGALKEKCDNLLVSRYDRIDMFIDPKARAGTS